MLTRRGPASDAEDTNQHVLCVEVPLAGDPLPSFDCPHKRMTHHISVAMHVSKPPLGPRIHFEGLLVYLIPSGISAQPVDIDEVPEQRDRAIRGWDEVLQTSSAIATTSGDPSETSPLGRP